MKPTKTTTRKQAPKDPHQPWPPDDQPVKPVRIVCDPASLEPKDYKQWFVYRPTIKIENQATPAASENLTLETDTYLQIGTGLHSIVTKLTKRVHLKVGESVQVQFERVRVCGHLPSGPAEVQLIPTVTFDGAQPGPEQWADSPPLGQIATIVEQGVAPNSNYRWVVDNSAWLNRPIDYTAKYALLTSVLNFGDGYPRDVLLTWVQRTSLVDVFLGDGTPLMWSVILPEVTASSDKQISFRIRPNMGLPTDTELDMGVLTLLPENITCPHGGGDTLLKNPSVAWVFQCLARDANLGMLSASTENPTAKRGEVFRLNVHLRNKKPYSVEVAYAVESSDRFAEKEMRSTKGRKSNTKDEQLRFRSHGDPKVFSPVPNVRCTLKVVGSQGEASDFFHIEHIPPQTTTVPASSDGVITFEVRTLLSTPPGSYILTPTVASYATAINEDGYNHGVIHNYISGSVDGGTCSPQVSAGIQIVP